jgi:hypothetical protein
MATTLKEEAVDIKMEDLKVQKAPITRFIFAITKSR